MDAGCVISLYIFNSVRFMYPVDLFEFFCDLLFVGGTVLFRIHFTQTVFPARGCLRRHLNTKNKNHGVKNISFPLIQPGLCSVLGFKVKNRSERSDHLDSS